MSGLLILIIETANDGKFRLWLSATDLARATKKQADDDAENYKEVAGGAFRVFERQ
jgi:hypothetical protein